MYSKYTINLAHVILLNNLELNLRSEIKEIQSYGGKSVEVSNHVCKHCQKVCNDKFKDRKLL